MSKLCTSCGTELPDEAAFCTQCGTPLGETVPLPSPGPQPPFEAGHDNERTDYDSASDPWQQPREKTFSFKKVAIIVIAAVVALRLLAGVVELGIAFFEDRAEARRISETIQPLDIALPTMTIHTPDHGFVIKWGGITAGIPFDYDMYRSDHQRRIVNPEYPKKVDEMIMTYDDSYTPADEEDVLAQYKSEFNEVTVAAKNVLDDYTLYFIVGRKKVENKSCNATCALILKDDEMYSARFTTSLKNSQLGPYCDYMGFDPSIPFEADG